MTKKIKLDNDEIKRLYLSGLSSFKIAPIFDVSYATIIDRLKREGVSIRSHKDQMVPSEIARTTYLDRNWLEQQYCVLKKTQAQIAESCGCSPTLIGLKMNKFGIPGRTPGDVVKHFRMNSHLNELFSGLLLGDGCVAHASSVAAQYLHTDKNKKYLEWMVKEFSKYGIETGKIYTEHQVVNGNKCTAYHVYTRSYAEFLCLRNKWYPSGVKIVPKDIMLTPTTCQCWAVGDGTLAFHPESDPYFVLYTNGFEKNAVLMLIDRLGEIGIQATYKKSMNAIRINPKNTIAFLGYMGDLPPAVKDVYGYKWSLTKRKKEWEAEFCPTAA